jgi:hypothetical protein
MPLLHGIRSWKTEYEKRRKALKFIISEVEKKQRIEEAHSINRL